MTLEIYDESGAGLPGTRLAGGTLQTSNALGLGWWGVSFDGLAVLQAATNYWLVWREAGGSRLPYEPGGATVPWARFTGGNWVLQATQQPLKWRGFCSLLDGQGLAPVGNACTSSSGKLPATFANYAPTVGNGAFQFEATGFTPGSIALALLGANPAWTPFPVPGAPAGCVLNVDPVVVATVPVGAGNQQATHAVGAAGHCYFDLPIPANPALVGFAIEDGAITSVDDPVARYLPAVKGTVFEKLTIRHLLTMSTGLTWTEGTATGALYRQMLEAMERTGGMEVVLAFKGLAPRAEPGTSFFYSSLDSELLGRVLAAAVRKSVSAYFEEKLWTPMGAGADAVWYTDRANVERTHCCVGATSRDFGRLGALLANKGSWNGRQVVPARWLEEMTTLQGKHLEKVAIDREPRMGTGTTSG